MKNLYVVVAERNRMTDLKNIFKNKKTLIIELIIIGLLPFFSGMIYCWQQGGSIFDIYFPASEWNDELFYYKQIESIVNYGIPQGYFGYNEGHAKIASFGVWSPALYIPWSVFSFLLSWDIYTPVVMNIIFISAALVFLVIMTRPSKSQFAAIVILFFLFKSETRYMLALMPEMICHAFVIMIYAIAIMYQKNEHKKYLVLMTILAVYAVWMRPYLVLFLLLPLWFICAGDKKRGWLYAAMVTLFAIGGYCLIDHYLQADYFDPLNSSNWLETFGREGVASGIVYLGQIIIESIRELSFWIFIFGLAGRPEGGYYIVYMTLTAAWIAQLVSDSLMRRKLKKNGNTVQVNEYRKRMIIDVHMVISFVAMFFAVILMYRLQEGAKHILLFICVGTLILCVHSNKNVISRILVLAILFTMVFWIKMSPEDGNHIPMKDDVGVAKQAYWEETFSENIKFNRETIPSYDNTILWCGSDQVDGNIVLSDWTILYALPAGTGINYIQSEHVFEETNNLKSHYIMMPKGGEVEKFCNILDYTKIGDDGNTVVYDRFR